jgi:3-dehydroquinate synthase
MPKSVTIALGERSYEVLIGVGLLDEASVHLAPFIGDRPATIVTDTHLARDQLARLTKSLGATADPIILPAGEETKSWASLSFLCDSLLARGINRSDHIIAFGGGVIGDLVGFAASILKRGCHFIQIPTSLLAQVDSSVGGKTAINTAAGKNLVGAFHQPTLVLIDPSVLATLPARDMRSGYAEIVKYGLINDFAFFEWCEKNATALLAGDREAQIYAIEKSVRTKAAIVAADERETLDMRALLNLGHTFGHALEAETGFSGKLTHGEGVALGIVLAHRFSARLGYCTRQEAERVAMHIRSVGLPSELREIGIQTTGETLVAHMLHDKKKTAETLPFILSQQLGQAYVDKGVHLSDVIAFLDEETQRGL